MKQDATDSQLELFRQSVRKFVEREVVPHQPQWEQDGIVSRDVWRKAGEAGFLCMDVAEEYGGAGVDDFRFNVIVREEIVRVGATGLSIGLHNDVITPYIVHHANDEQKQRWLPGMVTGEIITAIAMSEPAAGSDLKGIGTTATRDGDHYILNGQKTFISNGILNDLCVVVAKTDPDAGHKGISLLVVERGMEGYERGRRLEKIGMHAQDTAELFFNNVRVPKQNLLGDEGQGFIYLMHELPQERLGVAVSAVVGAETILEQTVKYCHERHAFGRPIGKFQNSRFKLAEMKTEVHIARVFLDHCVVAHNRRELSAEEAAMVKWWTTELQNRVVDTCLQLHGGYGYMMEYPVAKAFCDARVQTIFGGTTEIMKEIIGRSMGF